MAVAVFQRAVLGSAAVLVLAIGGCPLPAAAFKLPVHENLVRVPLGAAGVPKPVLDPVVGTFLSGTGNLGSDRYQADAYRHFDNAPDPATVCTRARDAWTRFYNEIRTAVTPGTAPEYSDVQGVDRARESFGALTHSLQDFYAHSNWTELFVDVGQTPPTADALFPSCSPGQLPAGLQTGYYEFALTNWGGCPKTGPPAGYKFCHETLNKDDGAAIQGGRTIPGTPLTYHQVAAQLAGAHTTKLYQLVVTQLRNAWAAAYPNARADCLIERVFQASTQPCRFGRITLTNVSSSIRLGAGTVELLGQGGQTLATYQVVGWPAPPIQTKQCLAGMSVRWNFTVIDPYSLPGGRRGAEGTAAIGTGGCDGKINIDPRGVLNYFVRFTSTDTKIAVYTDVVVTINNGSRVVSGGPVFAGATIWIDLGACSTVANLDFIIRFPEPGTGIPREAIPDPPPYAATQVCQEAVAFGDLGGQTYP